MVIYPHKHTKTFPKKAPTTKKIISRSASKTTLRSDFWFG